MEAVLAVAEGRIRVPEEAVKEVFARIRAEGRLAPRRDSDRLTALERETLVLFASVMSYTQIAEEGGKSTVTIRNTLYRIQDKLGLKTKQALVIWAVRNGLMDDVSMGSAKGLLDNPRARLDCRQNHLQDEDSVCLPQRYCLR